MRILLRGVLLPLVALVGCNSPSQTESDAAPEPKSSQVDTAEETVSFEPVEYGATAEQLLAARLPAEETRQGWVRLFDGHTFFGWERGGNANFRIEDGTIVVDKGDVCLLCTSTSWSDFELSLEFQADEKTNSGIFVRTPLEPDDPGVDCYEINIAPNEHPFPTGSIVERQKVNADSVDEASPQDWRPMTIKAEGKQVTVSIAGKEVCSHDDPVGLGAGRIGLQHNSGRVAFRDIRIRPLRLQPMLDKELSNWKRYPEMPGEFTINDEGDLHVVGGRSQLETKQSYSDFNLLAEYKIDDAEMNSGIFFRCIPGDEMMGYECQVNNAFKDDSRLSPADCGTGGIFRRQDARVVAGETGQWSTVLLQAHGSKIAAWVGGIQVSDWEDTRPPHENPRKGKRLAPGTIMIQGHDPGTDVLFRNLQIASEDS